MKVENIYTSAACNRTPQSVDWGENGLILYAASNAVVVCRKHKNESFIAEKCYVRHTKRVNTVKWVRPEAGGPETEFISGSDDGRSIIWSTSRDQVTSLVGHTSGVTTLDATYHSGKLLAVTGSSDSSIRIWERISDTEEAHCVQKVELRGFCFAVKMQKLKSANKILIAYATDDCKVHLMTELQSTESGNRFSVLHRLSGHEDWVRGLDFFSESNGDLLLASSSQDTFVRIWRISQSSSNGEVDEENDIDEIQLEYDSATIPVAGSDEPCNVTFHLESVLQSHEGWVFGAHWANTDKGLTLLSSSIDKTLVVWSIANGVWMEKLRLGEVGGNALGFYGAKFSPNGDAVVAHGHQGSLHLWSKSKGEGEMWAPGVIVSGHFNEVRDLAWSPEGEYLLSVSADQTTRAYGPWLQNEDTETTWHEIARPQVHGYDMQCISVLSKYRFASGAEEKIVRVFEAPGNFVENFQRICKGNVIIPDELETKPKGASVPSLGLSNKAVYDVEEPNPEDKHVTDIYPENYFVPTVLNCPPQEETLMQNTLWPEVQKLYGHGYEIFALASSPDGKWLASSCKATSADHAAIIIWNTSSWKQVQSLVSHQLTVTQMKFSPNNKFLISVSRDRRWTLFENKATEDACNFEIVAGTDKSNTVHSRIIWSCDWAPDSSFFVTSSRDGKVIPWVAQENKNEWQTDEVLELKKESVTAVACSYKNVEGKWLIALGLETGVIHLYSYKPWKLLFSLDNSGAHHATVRKLQFRPNSDDIELASCGDDCFVKIYRIKL